MSDKEKYRKLKPEDFFDYSEDRLSDRERHDLERQLQGDPFDAEAAEGLQKVSRDDASDDIGELTGRLNRRISRRRRITIYSAAAAVASLLIISTIFFNVDTGNKTGERLDELSRAADQIPALQDERDPEPASEEQVLQEKPAAGAAEGARQPDPSPQTGKAEATGSEHSREAMQRDLPEIKTAVSPAEDLDPAVPEEVEPNMEDAYETAEFMYEADDEDKLSREEESAAEVDDEAAATGDADKEKLAPARKKEYISDVDHREIQKAAEPDPDRQKLFLRSAPKETATLKGADVSADQFHVSGVVISGEDSMPIPGATVMIKGTSQGGVTDLHGNFNIALGDTDESTLVASSVGMETEEITVTPGRPVQIALEPSAESLGEVVVVGYGTSGQENLTGSVAEVDISNARESDYTAAMPVTGLKAFREYVKTNLEFPVSEYTGDRAVVVLKFRISDTNRPGNIEVVRSPGDAFSREAIRILEQGPHWNRATMNGNPVNDDVRLRVVFRKEM